MALVTPESRVTEEALRAMLAEHLEGIREMAARLENPPHPVTDAARIDLARSFAADVLRILEPGATSSSVTLRDRVNLSYEAMLILIDYAKTYTESPKVPRSRSSSA